MTATEKKDQCGVKGWVILKAKDKLAKNLRGEDCGMRSWGKKCLSVSSVAS